MTIDFSFTVKKTRFDADYHPASSTRVTTNFANLARGSHRRDNLQNALRMIDNRCNALASWDNPTRDRYAVELDIISVEMNPGEGEDTFPAIEMLKTSIVDRKHDRRIEGVVGNNFSSYVRDYDFSVLLPNHNDGRTDFSVPGDFGDLHGKIFKHFLGSSSYRENFAKLPVICLSVSHNKTYYRSTNRHPVLGVEYTTDETSLTEAYFRKMGMDVRYFMPEQSVAPLAFYFYGDLLNDYTNLELVGTIGTMESFQRIYRPEIYNANTPAGDVFKPSLDHHDHSITQIVYDREERRHLAITQGRYAEETFIKPHQTLLREWSAQFAR